MNKERREIKCELIEWRMLEERNKKAEEYSANVRKRSNKRNDNFLKKIVATILVCISVIMLGYGVIAKANSKEYHHYKATESRQADGTHYISVTDRICTVTETTKDKVTVEYKGNLYSFYAYKTELEVGDKVICEFTDNWEIIDTHEVKTETTETTTKTTEEITTEEIITEEPTTETQKFFNVPLSKDLQLHIFAECEKYNIAPAFIIAIIERESNYNADAIGDNGNSLGLMQIQPRWYKEKMSELGVTDLLNPYQNITLGVSIVSDLFQKYNDDIYTLLMEYNGGLAYANKMKSQGKVSDYALTIADRSYQLETEIYGK